MSSLQCQTLNSFYTQGQVNSLCSASTQGTANPCASGLIDVLCPKGYRSVGTAAECECCADPGGYGNPCPGCNCGGAVLKMGCTGKPFPMPQPTPTGDGLKTLKCCTKQGYAETSMSSCGNPEKPTETSGWPCCSQGFCPSGDGCGEVMEKYCTQNEWNRVSDACRDYLTLSKNTKAKTLFAQNFLQQTYGHATGRETPCPNGVKGCDLNDVTAELCGTAPGACDEQLKWLCSDVKYSDLIKDDSLRKVCGCFLQPKEYPFASLAKEIQCEPMCVYPGSVCTTGSTGKCEVCTEGNCIISGINVNQINSSNDVTFNQYCPAKTKNSRCFIDQSVQNILNENANARLNQNCGSCFVFDSSDPAGTLKQTDCKNIVEGNSFWNRIKSWLGEKRNIEIVVGVLGFLILVLVVLMIVFTFGKSKKLSSSVTIKTPKTKTPTQPKPFTLTKMPSQPVVKPSTLTKTPKTQFEIGTKESPFAEKIISEYS